LIILGVDPGSIRTGFGAIESDGRRHRLIEKGVLAPPRRAELPERLHFVHSGISSLVARHRPDILAVEDLFHAVNTRSAIVLAHVRGVIVQAGAAAGVSVHAFAPATVKLQVAGNGQAEKGQVALMVSRLLGLTTDAQAGDAADALAVALCHAHLNGRTAVLRTGGASR
jgi:crossover junction endodeoxyribonuclease RuvC